MQKVKKLAIDTPRSLSYNLHIMANAENPLPFSEFQPEIKYQHPQPVNVAAGTAQVMDMYLTDSLPDLKVASVFLNEETIPFLNRAEDGFMEDFRKIRDPRKLSKENIIKLLEERRLTDDTNTHENVEAFWYTALIFGEMHSKTGRLLPIKFSSRMMLAPPFTVIEYLERIRELQDEVVKFAKGEIKPNVPILNNQPLVRSYLFFQTGKELQTFAA
jgi:hypothetical protein